MTSGRRPVGSEHEEQLREGGPEAQETAAGDFFSDSGNRSPTDGDSDSGAAVDADLDALLADVTRERDEYLELAKRTRADFENYRRRSAQQAADAERKAKVSLARDLIPAIDNLERALETAPADDPLADGVRLVHRELTEALTRAGIESFDPTGEVFDPNSSEALSSQPRESVEPGTVLEVVARGYHLADQLIRPARVVVAE